MKIVYRINTELRASSKKISKSHTSTLMAFCSFHSNFFTIHELSKLVQIAIFAFDL